MKILVDDGLQIQLGTGIGRYISYLVESLRLIHDIQIDFLEYPFKTSSRKKNRIEYLKFINSAAFAKIASNYDLVFFANYAMPFCNINQKTVVCIPDMVSFLYPETLPRLYGIYNRAMIRNSINRADRIVTISRSVKHEIIQKFPKSLPKVDYTWLGLCGNISKLSKEDCIDISKYVGSSNYFLFVSTIELRKNVDSLIRAFGELKISNPNASSWKLVLAGRPGLGFEDIKRCAYNTGFQADIVFTGYLPDDVTNQLYNGAAAFVFPSKYEGFGFAQIECMECATPIILSDIPTNREISRNFGIFFDLNDNNSLVEAMSKLVNNEFDLSRLYSYANEYMSDFSWDKIAEEYYQIFIRTITDVSAN